MADISPITGIAAALLLAPAGWAQDTTRPPPLVIAGVTVVDVRAGALLPSRTVVVEDGRIARVASAGSVIAPPGAIVVDGTGRFLIPGLIDMHTHPQPRDFPLYLAAGVTTLRVMAGNRQQLRLREEVRTGRRLGPTLVVRGPIVESPPPAGYGSIVTANRRHVTTAEEGAREVEAQRAAGFDFIKIYNHLSADAYAGITHGARERGMDVVGHVPFAVGIEGALSDGMRTIEHGRGYLHMLLPPEINAATGPDLMLMNRSRIQWASNFSEDDFRAADHAYAVKSRVDLQ